MHANVNEVTVTDRHVLVPLVTLPLDECVVLEHCNRLVTLVNEGLPFAQVQDWLEKFLLPGCYLELKAKYA